MTGRPDGPRSQEAPEEHDDYHRDVYDSWDEQDEDRTQRRSRGTDFGLLLLRLGLLLLVPHGLAKAGDMVAFVETVDSNVIGAQAPEFFAWMVMLGQVALPLLVAVGLFTRPAAFLVAAMMVTIWSLAVYLRLDYTLLTGTGGLTGEPALLYAALALPLAFTGAGRWSADSMRTGGRP
jgi:putative oxidoreductase